MLPFPNDFLRISIDRLDDIMELSSVKKPGRMRLSPLRWHSGKAIHIWSPFPLQEGDAHHMNCWGSLAKRENPSLADSDIGPTADPFGTGLPVDPELGEMHPHPRLSQDPLGGEIAFGVENPRKDVVLFPSGH